MRIENFASFCSGNGQ